MRDIVPGIGKLYVKMFEADSTTRLQVESTQGRLAKELLTSLEDYGQCSYNTARALQVGARGWAELTINLAEPAGRLGQPSHIEEQLYPVYTNLFLALLVSGALTVRRYCEQEGLYFRVETGLHAGGRVTLNVGQHLVLLDVQDLIGELDEDTLWEFALMGDLQVLLTYQFRGINAALSDFGLYTPFTKGGRTDEIPDLNLTTAFRTFKDLYVQLKAKKI